MRQFAYSRRLISVKSIFRIYALVIVNANISWTLISGVDGSLINTNTNRQIRLSFIIAVDIIIFSGVNLCEEE